MCSIVGLADGQADNSGKVEGRALANVQVKGQREYELGELQPHPFGTGHSILKSPCPRHWPKHRQL